jgi:hypothetical protein
MIKVIHNKITNRMWSLLSILLLLPQVVSAQSQVPQTPTNFKSLVCIFVKLILDFIPYVVVIAIGAFLTGLIKYVANGDNEEKRSAGTKMMVYGIVGFFFMVAIWGIIEIFVNSFALPFGVPQLAAPDNGFNKTCSYFSVGGE